MATKQPTRSPSITRRARAAPGANGAVSTLPPHALDLARLRDESLTLLRRRARLSAAASVVPLPGVDALADVTLLLELLPKITERFGLAPDQMEALDAAQYSVAMKAIRTLGPTLIGKVVTTSVVVALAKRVGVTLTAKQAGKYVPIIGSAAAAVLGYTAFMTLGKRHIEQCVAVRQAIANGDRPARA